MDKEKRNQELIYKSKQVIKDVFEKHDPSKCAITWTGGKDSTADLWIVRQVCVEENIPLPQVITIDEGDAFPEITDFLVTISKKWNIDLKWLCNFDVLTACLSHLGNTVLVERLNKRNQEELKRIEFSENSFVFEAESFAGNHLMKTVPLNQFIEESGTELLFMALRRDEQTAWKEDEYFTHKKGEHLMPEHDRVSPFSILLKEIFGIIPIYIIFLTVNFIE